jgi:hypothetical protein
MAVCYNDDSQKMRNNRGFHRCQKLDKVLLCMVLVLAFVLWKVHVTIINSIDGELTKNSFEFLFFYIFSNQRYY